MNSTHISLGKAAAIAAVGTLAAVSERSSSFAEIHAPVQRWVARSVATLVERLGMPTFVDGTHVYSIGYSVEVIPACDGLLMYAVVVVGCLLLNVSWRRRAVLAGLGVVAVTAVNLVRVATTLIVGTRNLDAAMIGHDVVFPIALYLLYAYVWFRWLRAEFSPVSTPVGSAA